MRRKKLAGYLQAANEIRQSYTAGYNNARPVDSSGDEWAQQMGVSQVADGQLILFPSYARMRPMSGGEDREIPREAPDAWHEDWKLDDQSYNEYDAIIEVDVRGWLYVPHSGPMSRKNKYALWVARQLCGLPAQALDPIAPAADNPTPQEAEEARQTASEMANGTTQRPSPPQSEGGLDGSSTSSSRWSYWISGDGGQQQPVLSPEQLKEAHAAFTRRMAPFTYRPIADVPVTVFFYNDTTSQSRSIQTSANGHFSLRAQLPFIPTHVRVLASETLSATEEICLHPPDGISLISDIDDTIKHSAISLGMREVFRNTFTAPLPTLAIAGVGQWYKKLAAPPYDVSMHYISNSPWQLYPLLKSFFQETGLPPGSFHLKQYSGMFQGIFEPAADRKKGTVERVITDFPHRKWILVGDSGEADLEVYTEVAERWPDKILAICIRDVTTTPLQEAGLFDASKPFGPQNRDQPPPLSRRGTRESIDRLRGFSVGQHHPLAHRGTQNTAERVREPESYEQPPPPSPVRPGSSPYTYASYSGASTPASSVVNVNSVAPPRPEKPASLRSPPVPAKSANLSRGTSPSEGSSASSLYDGNEYPPPPRNEYPPPPRSEYPPRPRRANTAPRDASIMPPQLPGRTATSSTVPAADQVNKREELWRRRWDLAQDRLRDKGVQLVSWRVGKDVEELTLALVGREMQRLKKAHEK